MILIKDAVTKNQKHIISTFNIQIHTNTHALASLFDDWMELAELSNQTMCMFPDWVDSWWRHFGQNNHRSLYIITVRDDDKLVAIFPFYKGVTRLGKIILDQRLQILGSGGNENEQLGFTDDYGISDYLDFLVDPDYNESIADLFITLLINSELSQFRISLNHIRDDSYIKTHIYPRLIRKDWQIKVEKTDVCPYIELNGLDNILSFVEQAKSNARRRFRQIFRAEGPDKEYVIQDAKTLDDIDEMTTNLIRLHQNRWNEIGYPGAFHDHRFRNFFKEITFSAYKNNRLWFKQAIDSSGVCASRMLLLYNGRYYDYMSGYDDNSPSSKHRPGIALLLNLIGDALDKKATHVDLLRGNEGYKYDFAQNELANWKIIIPALSNRKKMISISKKLLFASSFIYKHAKREILLMKVQYKKGGFFKMIVGYLKFRPQSIFS